MDFEYMVYPFTVGPFPSQQPPPALATFQPIERSDATLTPVRVTTTRDPLTLEDRIVVEYRKGPTEEQRLTKAFEDARSDASRAYTEWNEALQRSADAREELDAYRQRKSNS